MTILTFPRLAFGALLSSAAAIGPASAQRIEIKLDSVPFFGVDVDALSPGATRSSPAPTAT